jgi:phosphoglycolate phosphatase-like HAD superfamily hydrolase
MPVVIFDIDGTLIDTDGINDSCYVQSIKELWGEHVPVNQDWSSYPHMTDPGVAKAIYKSWKNEEAKAEDLARLEEILTQKVFGRITNEPSRCREVDGAVGFFSLLAEKNIPVAIATGGWRRSAAMKLNEILKLNMENYTYATASDHHTRHDIIRTAIGRLGHRRTDDRVIYFGDAIWDFRTCADLQIEFIGIDYKKRGILQKAGAPFVFDHYLRQKELMEIILKNN